ncbi:MAG: DUF305 domain-containing protein [Chryseolinea sp.]
MEHHSHKEDQKHKEHNKHYSKLLIMLVLSFECMYILMYAMVNNGSNVIPNTNQFYMAGLITMPMIIIELLLMKNMYMNNKLNALILGISIIGLIGFYTAIRQQTAINDKQFLKSMIPHHAGVILMCNEANITDPEIKKLCEEIVSGQKKEIELMKSKLEKIKDQ